MPRPPDYPGQMGRGGSAGPNAAAPLIPTVIRAGSRGAVKTTTSNSAGRYRTQTVATAAEGESMTDLSLGPIDVTPADGGGEWIVAAYAILPFDIPAGILRVLLAGPVDGYADDRLVKQHSHRGTASIVTAGPVTAIAVYLPDAGFTPGADIGLTLITNARRL